MIQRTFFSSQATDTVVSDAESILPSSSQPLGTPLPADEHACSVSLPTWSSVVGYEEGDVNITSALRCGYPRFVYHPYVIQLMDVIIDRHGNKSKDDCLVLPTLQAAIRCQLFLQQAVEKRKGVIDNALVVGSTNEDNNSQQSHIRVVSLPDAGVHAVLFPAVTFAGMEAKAYWQHTGEVVSSRRAELALHSLNVPLKQRVTKGPSAPYVYHSCFKTENPRDTHAESPHRALRERIAGWAGVPSGDHVFLATAGMASIYTALRSARRYQLEQNPGGKGGASVVYGFPYLDTLKLCSRVEFCPGGVEFFGRGDERDLSNLERLLRSNRYNYSALFTEVPSNPLLRCPDLHRLRELADEFNFCLVVDDTISNFLNVDIIRSGLADAVCSSLTKLVSGRGDAIAGSIVANPNTPKGRWMQQDLLKNCTDCDSGLHESDAVAILKNSVDFPERNAKINQTAEALADWFAQHPDVQTVHYPKNSTTFKRLQSPSGGFGGLMSIILHPHMCQRSFYDALDVAKGPSLGTDFTLVCPYTLLAHYHELDFAMSYDVPPNLLRISIGLESFETLKTKFKNALESSRLYPKVSLDSLASQKRTFSTRCTRSTSTLQRPHVLQTVRRGIALIK